MKKNMFLICALLVGYNYTYTQEQINSLENQAILPEKDNQLEENTSLSEPHEACNQEEQEQKQEQEIKENAENEAKGQQEAPLTTHAHTIKVKAVLLRLHAIDRAKALQYACALAVQLQYSNHPTDQELYQILCQYISLAYQEMNEQQENCNDNNDTEAEIEAANQQDDSNETTITITTTITA